MFLYSDFRDKIKNGLSLLSVFVRYLYILVNNEKFNLASGLQSVQVIYLKVHLIIYAILLVCFLEKTFVTNSLTAFTL